MGSRFTTYYQLAYRPGPFQPLQLVINTQYAGELSARTLLADRKANGEAFPDEIVVRVTELSEAP